MYLGYGEWSFGRHNFFDNRISLFRLSRRVHPFNIAQKQRKAPQKSLTVPTGSSEN
jgi:hypothetical protein